ncbi:unnamed protein product [Merluccius merluccius]
MKNGPRAGPVWREGKALSQTLNTTSPRLGKSEVLEMGMAKQAKLKQRYDRSHTHTHTQSTDLCTGSRGTGWVRPKRTHRSVEEAAVRPVGGSPGGSESLEAQQAIACSSLQLSPGGADWAL